MGYVRVIKNNVGDEGKALMTKHMLERAIVIPDLHIPLHDTAAVSCCMEAISIVKPSIAIFLGDIGEWDSISSWKYAKKKRPPLEYVINDLKDEQGKVNKVLDEFDEMFKKNNIKRKIMMLGNHELWLDYFVEENSLGDNPLRSFYDCMRPRNIMNLENRGYEVYDYGQYLQIGELHFYHGGHHSGINHARQHAIHLGTNVIYAHGHDVSRSSITNLNGVHAAFSIGCLKKVGGKDNKWLKGRKVNWGHSFAIVDWMEDGTFRTDIVDITGGKTVLWGKRIDGNKKG